MCANDLVFIMTNSYVTTLHHVRYSMWVGWKVVYLVSLLSFSVGSSVCRAHGRVVAHYDISQGPPASGVSDPLIGRTPTRRPYIRTPLTLLVYFSARPPSWGLVSAGAFFYFQPVLTILGVLPFIFRSSLWVWGSI